MAEAYEFCLADFLRVIAAGADPEHALPDGWTLDDALLESAGRLDDFAQLKHTIQSLDRMPADFIAEQLHKLCKDERFQAQSFDVADVKRRGRRE